MKIHEIAENISHTSKRLRDIEREKKVKPGSDEWFKLWFSLPYLKESLSSEPDATGYQHTALTNPQYSIIVNTPGELDWYKLGQHFATLGQQDPHEFGQPESDMMIVAPNKEQLMRYMQELDRLGATYKLVGSSHEHPEVHVEAKSEEGMIDDRSRLIYGQPGSKLKELVQKLDNKILNINGLQYKIEFENFGHGVVAFFALDINNTKNHFILNPFTMTLHTFNDVNLRYPLTQKQLQGVEESNVFTNARMNAIKAGKKEFSVRGKTYQVTGDIKDELEAETNESRTFQPQMTPMQDLIAEYQMFSSFGQMGLSDYAKSPDSAEKIKEVVRTLSQSNKNLQNLDKQTLEKNKNKILTHIHDMMNYAIAHFREHLKPEQFDAKKQQINKLLTKYNNITSTNENIIREQPDGAQTNESLDQPYSYNWVDQKKHEWEAVAPLPRGLDLRIRFEKDRDNIWDIEFLLGKNLRATGEGDQYRIFATVVKAVTEWAKWLLSSKQPVRAIHFSAIKDDEQDTGRARLYDRFAKQLASGIGFDYKNLEKGLITKFILSNPNYKKVKENVAELAENFADGKNPGRKGLAKRMGVNTKASVSSLRKTAKNSTGEKQRMAHWLANMKAGREK